MSNCHYRKMPSEEYNLEEVDLMGEASPIRLEDGESRARALGGFYVRMINVVARIWTQIAKVLRNLLHSLSGAFNLAFTRGDTATANGLRQTGDYNVNADKDRQKRTEAELKVLNFKITRLLYDINLKGADEAGPGEDECVICISSVASILTFPCRHQVTCQKCFVKTIQNAVDTRQLPLRCVICRCRITSLRNTRLNRNHSKNSGKRVIAQTRGD